MRISNRIRNSRGFTLVELLVAAALCMFIMAILATAFTKGIDTFRFLRSAGNMQERLRMASIVIKRDLAAQHFDGGFRPGFSGPYLSDQRLDQIGWIPPQQGYFFLYNGSPGVYEGADADGIWSTRAVDHQMAMTVKLPGITSDQLFYADAPTYANNPLYNLPDYLSASVVASPWAEVRYFMVANGQNANGTPLYTLYRRQAVPFTTSVSNVGGSQDPNFWDLCYTSANGGTINSPDLLTNPANRMPSQAMGGTNNTGDDILIGDVLSFEIKPHWMAGSASAATGVGFPQLNPGAANLPTGAPYNGDYPFDVLPNSPNGQGRYFDTWSRSINPNLDWNDPSVRPSNPLSALKQGNGPPLRIRIDSIQIRIRIWDAKAQQARQITIVQDV